jgi:hypothetical protein
MVSGKSLAKTAQYSVDPFKGFTITNEDGISGEHAPARWQLKWKRAISCGQFLGVSLSISFTRYLRIVFPGVPIQGSVEVPEKTPI